MSEFLTLLSPGDALSRLLHAMPQQSPIRSERLPTSSALGRVLAEAVRAPIPLPPFARSSVDGFAVRASDTFGASPSLPAYLLVTGEVPMGAAPSLVIVAGQAALIHTGGMLPDGADAVVMVEDVQVVREGEIEVFKAAAPGQNVLLQGEDVAQGEIVVEAGVRLRAQEIGGLIALGVTEVEVARRPRVAILSTGDELVPPEAAPNPGQVRDVNSYTLSALIQAAGGEPIRYGILPDRLETIVTAAVQARESSDLVVLTAGSSVSTRDMTAEVLNRLGEPGVLVHGVALKPGKPTILGLADGVPVVGLPGNPVSAIVVARLFVIPLLQRLSGAARRLPAPSIMARIGTNIASEAGREDFIPVRLELDAKGWRAEPVHGRSNLIFPLVRADGLVRIPSEATGVAPGSQVEVELFDPLT